VNKLKKNIFIFVIILIVGNFTATPLTVNAAEPSAAKPRSFAGAETHLYATVLECTPYHISFFGSLDSGSVRHLRYRINSSTIDEYDAEILDAQDNQISLEAIKKDDIIKVTFPGHIVDIGEIVDLYSIQLVNVSEGSAVFDGIILECTDSFILVQGFLSNDIEHRGKITINLNMNMTDLESRVWLLDSSGNSITPQDLKRGNTVRISYDGNVIKMPTARIEGDITLQVTGAKPVKTAVYARVTECDPSQFITVQTITGYDENAEKSYRICLTNENEPVTVFGSNGKKINNRDIKEGDVIKIIYDGTETETSPARLTGGILIRKVDTAEVKPPLPIVADIIDYNRNSVLVNDTSLEEDNPGKPYNEINSRGTFLIRISPDMEYDIPISDGMIRNPRVYFSYKGYILDTFPKLIIGDVSVSD
jgi:hypothetical protein